MIEVMGLTKYYGQLAAIEDVTFSVDEGEVIGFLGPNGAGKTTTMRILAGFSPASRGKAVVAGYDIGQRPLEVKRRVGYLPENVPLYREMLVSRFLDYVADVKAVPSRERRGEVGRVMERCGLEHMAKRIIGNLSKGYRQRVGLAQALIGNPPVLILDEPTVGLDPRQIVEIRQMIKDLGEDHTVLLSTHILPEVTMVCERVVIVNGGRVVAQDSLDSLAKGGETTYDVAVDAPEEQVSAVLKTEPKVVSFTSHGGGRYEVKGAPDCDLGTVLSGALAGLGLRELRAHTHTLEDVFIGVVSSEAAAGEHEKGGGA
ncbi:MAG: ATP-binding cassette domain-containing protein [Nitrospiraceae bacterium]|nr:ATP-binding cassette domain-containing protein [Nitrospiraceae bacterium]